MQFPEPVLNRNMPGLIDADYYSKTDQAGEEVLEHVVFDLCLGRVSDKKRTRTAPPAGKMT